MEYVQIKDIPPGSLKSVVLCIGKFDGLHLGHQHLLRAAKNYVEDGDILAVMTFSEHPLWVLQQNINYKAFLTPLQERLQLFNLHGVQRAYEIQFTPQFAQTSPETFVFKYLSAMNLKRIVVGEDFHFGKGGTSDVCELESLCGELGIPVTSVPLFKLSGQKIGSTDIRQLITAGRVENAGNLLGRNYRISGFVVGGDRLGRKLGFPTVNLSSTEEYVLPAAGVYLGIAEIDNTEEQRKDYWHCLISAGYRPTVGGRSYKIEAFLLDFSGDLYDRYISLSFIKRMRDEINFPSLDELVVQMKKDEKEARHWFAAH